MLLPGGTRHMSTTTKTYVWVVHDSEKNSHAFETKKSAINCAAVFKVNLLDQGVQWIALMKRNDVILFQPTNDFIDGKHGEYDVHPPLAYYNEWVIVQKCEVTLYINTYL